MIAEKQKSVVSSIMIKLIPMAKGKIVKNAVKEKQMKGTGKKGSTGTINSNAIGISQSDIYHYAIEEEYAIRMAVLYPEDYSIN